MIKEIKEFVENNIEFDNKDLSLISVRIPVVVLNILYKLKYHNQEVSRNTNEEAISEILFNKYTSSKLEIDLENRFFVGDKVYFIENNIIQKRTVETVKHVESSSHYTLTGYTYSDTWGVFPEKLYRSELEAALSLL